MVVEPVSVVKDSGQTDFVPSAVKLARAEAVWFAPSEFADRPKTPMPYQTVRDFVDAPRQRPQMQMAPLGVGEFVDRQVHDCCTVIVG